MTLAINRAMNLEPSSASAAAGLLDLSAARHGSAWQRWRDLTRDAPPFLAPEFFVLVRPLADGDGALLAGAWRDGVMIGALPLIRRGRTLHTLSTECSPEYDYRGTREGLDAIWAALRADRRWDELVLDSVPEGSMLATRLPIMARATGYRAVLRPRKRHRYLVLPGFEARMSPKFRTNLERCARKAGGIALERLVTPTQADVDQAMAIEAMAWKAAVGTSMSSAARVAHVYRVLARLWGRRGRAALSFLRAGGERIAVLFAVEDDHTLYALKIGYDPAHANVSPGHLLVWKVAAEAEARGLRELNFVGHEDDWKRKWTELAHDCQRTDLIGDHTLLGRLHVRIDRGLGIERRIRAAVLPSRKPEPPRLGPASRFPVGSWVRVLDEPRLRATLDARSRLRGLAVVPSQWPTCGQVYRVQRHVRRMRTDGGLFRPIARTVLLEGVDCNGRGPEPAGCGRHCPLMYRDEWLEPAPDPVHAPPPADTRPRARVRDVAEIVAGLDPFGRRDGLSFLPEMRAYAGRRFAVAARLTRVFEDDRWMAPKRRVYLLDGLQCKGTVCGSSGPCDRACALLWHEDWLLLEGASS
jgi:CelD/BcsL family acetyltransferase involved in cellulose biosynthesis